MIKKIQIILITSLLLTGCSGTSPKLGVDNGQLTPCPETPNCVSSQAESEQHGIEPMAATGSATAIKNRILKTIDTLPRSEVVTVEDDYIRAEFTSRIMRFVDDVEFYFPDAGSDKTVIHVRSASRLGRSDLGVNRERIEKIRAGFEATE